MGFRDSLYLGHCIIYHCFLATMEVYKDFFLYGDGVYSKSDFAGSEPLGFHSVKIVGWGEENKNPYWVIIKLRTQMK